MTLKELRIKKGLTQSECASYLGMTLRNYQNYESGNMDKTAKYNYVFEKVKSYSSRNIFRRSIELKSEPKFLTNVVIRDDILLLSKKVENFKKRDCFVTLKKFIEGEFDGKLLILYGLRRTGKTTLIFQMISTLPYNECAYIKMKASDTMASLTKDLSLLHKLGYKYIFIDEITLLDDFINTAATLSDVYSMLGMKIILSGTDSLGFYMADRDELYDRNIMVHTSFISFKEYSYILDIKSIDSYIEYGGTLKKENMTFSDKDAVNDDVSFLDDESTRKYIDTSISRNIQHSLKNNSFGEYFNGIRDLYDNNELTNVINRVVENINHRFLLSVIDNEFKSNDFGSAKDLLLHDAPSERAYVLYDVNREQIVDRLKKLIDVKESFECKIKVTDNHIEQVKRYLLMLDLIVNIKDVYDNGIKEDHYIFTQPGMRYSIAKALSYSLMQDEYFNSLNEKDKAYILNKILEDVKGRMLEEIVLLETKKALSKNFDVFKYKFFGGGEFDMVKYDKIQNTCEIYEIKHSDKIIDKQTRFLLNNNLCEEITNRYGLIKQKYVLYRGETTDLDNGIKYLNVEEYLKSL